MQFSIKVQEAAQLWHARIGRFLSDVTWDKSLGAGYPTAKSKVSKQSNTEIDITTRLGVCLASAVMIDPNQAILIDKIALEKIRPSNAEGDFQYGQSIKGVNNVQKTQINWALDEARMYPMLLVRPGKASSMTCLALSHTDDQVIVCAAGASFSFEPKKVRSARDFIFARNLQSKWRSASQLRQTISLGEHLGTQRENALLDQHAAMLETFPLDVWLPEVGSGDAIALGDALAIKLEVDVATLPYAKKLLGKPQTGGEQ
jgi:hypothetical protein